MSEKTAWLHVDVVDGDVRVDARSRDANAVVMMIAVMRHVAGELDKAGVSKDAVKDLYHELVSVMFDILPDDEEEGA